MANRIKGITIEIGGDTSKFQKALSDVDKSLKTTQNQLRDVNRLLKFDPGNTDLLKQKQEALTKSIEGTKERLKVLRDAQKEAAEQVKNGKLGQDEYEALQREIADTAQKLEYFKKQYKDFGSVAKQQIQVVSDKMKSLGGSISSVGDTMTKTITGPIAALGGASIAGFKAVDAGYDEMIKKTGATGDAAEELRGIMENLATSIPTDFETAGNAVGEVATRFGVTGDELEELSGKFIKFADLNNTDVATSVDQVQKAISAYGLETKDAGALLDRLNKTSQDTGVGVDKLAEGLVSNGTSFQEMGLSIDQAVAFMGQLEKSGANSETVLNGMRKALKNATKEGKPLDQALSELQDTIQNGTGSVDGLTAAYDMFGKSGDQIYGAIKNGTLDFQALSQAATDASGNIEDTFKETEDPIKQFQTTLNLLKITLAEVAQPLLEILTPAIQKLAGFIQMLKEKWEALTPEQQAMVEKILLIVAAIGPLLAIIGKIVTLIGALTAAIGMIATPIGLVIVAIGALIAAGVLLYKHWDEVKEFCSETWNDIKQTFIDIFEGIKNDLINFVTTVRDNIVNYFTAIYDFWANVWENIKNAAVTAVTFIRDAIVNWFTKIRDFWQTTWEKVATFFSEAWDKMKSGIAEKAEAIRTAIQDGIGRAIQWIEELPGRAYSWGLDMIANFIQGISDKFKPFRDIIESVAGVVADFIGFSEPKKGPLSKFHTFAPDMLALFAQGIERNKGIVDRAMNDLAGGMNITGNATMNVNGDALAVNPNTNGVMSLLAQYLPQIAAGGDVLIDGDALVGSTANKMNKALGTMQVRERRR